MDNALRQLLFSAILVVLSGTGQAASLTETQALVVQGRYQEALAQIELLPRELREGRDGMLLRASTLVALKRKDEAEEVYQGLINNYPKDPAAYNDLAVLQARAGRLEEAGELLNRAIESDHRYATVYKNLSRVYVEMSRNSYAKALRLSGEADAVELLSLGLKKEDISLAAAQELVEPTPPIRQDDSKTSEQPLTEITPSGEVFDASTAVLAALQEWAKAWSEKDVDAYLAAYVPDYTPPQGGTHQQWRLQRKQRLSKPGKIEVTLEEAEVRKQGEKRLQVSLLQRYRSDNYRDSTRKGFVLLLQSGAWKIAQEYTIEVLH